MPGAVEGRECLNALLVAFKRHAIHYFSVLSAGDSQWAMSLRSGLGWKFIGLGLKARRLEDTSRLCFSMGVEEVGGSSLLGCGEGSPKINFLTCRVN